MRARTLAPKTQTLRHQFLACASILVFDGAPRHKQLTLQTKYCHNIMSQIVATYHVTTTTQSTKGTTLWTWFQCVWTTHELPTCDSCIAALWSQAKAQLLIPKSWKVNAQDGHSLDDCNVQSSYLLPAVQGSIMVPPASMHPPRWEDLHRLSLTQNLNAFIGQRIETRRRNHTFTLRLLPRLLAI